MRSVGPPLLATPPLHSPFGDPFSKHLLSTQHHYSAGKWGSTVIHQKPEIKKAYIRNSLVVQWLGIHTHCRGTCVLSPVWLFAAPWTVGHQAPLSMGFSRQEYWTGLPFPMPENLPDPGMEPTFLVSPALAGRFFSTEPYCHSSNSLMVYIIDLHCL